MEIKRVFGVISIAIFSVWFFFVPVARAATPVPVTPNLSLYLPLLHQSNWGGLMNSNLSTIDALFPGGVLSPSHGGCPYSVLNPIPFNFLTGVQPALGATLDGGGNALFSHGITTPGPVNIGTTYTTANTLAQLTADASFAGTVVYTGVPVTLTADLSLAGSLSCGRGSVITRGAYSLSMGSFSGGNYQCFNPSDSGNLNLGTINRVIPQWWDSLAGTPGHDSTAALNAASGYLKTNGGELYFPAGEYDTTTGVILWSNSIYRGASKNSTVIKYTGLVAGNVMVTDPSIRLTAHDITVQDITADGGQTAATTVNVGGITLWGQHDLIARNTVIRNFSGVTENGAISFETDASQTSDIWNMLAEYNTIESGYGVYPDGFMFGAPQGTFLRNIRFIGNVVLPTSGCNIGATGWNTKGCIFKSNKFWAKYASINFDTWYMDNVIIQDNELESPYFTIMLGYAATPYLSNNFDISHNTLIGDAGSPWLIELDGNDTDISIHDNSMFGQPGGTTSDIVYLPTHGGIVNIHSYSNNVTNITQWQNTVLVGGTQYGIYPSISGTGFGTGAGVNIYPWGGDRTFRLLIGSNPTGSGVLTFIPAHNGWLVSCQDITTPTNGPIRQTAYTTTSASIALPSGSFTAGDILVCTAQSF
jgi:hypothetical protein